MPDPRSSPPSLEPSPRSSVPIVASAAPLSSKLPFGAVALVLIGGITFLFVQRSLGPVSAATECLKTTLADQGPGPYELGTALEIVLSGKLEVGGKGSKEIANGLLSDPARLEAIVHCRAVHAKKVGISPVLPLLEVDRVAARISVERTLGRGRVARAENTSRTGDALGLGVASNSDAEPVSAAVAGAEVFVESFPGHSNCITSSTGECELSLRNLAHDARLTIAAKLPNGAVVTRSASVLGLLRDGLTLRARERSPVGDPHDPADHPGPASDAEPARAPRAAPPPD